MSGFSLPRRAARATRACIGRILAAVKLPRLRTCAPPFLVLACALAIAAAPGCTAPIVSGALQVAQFGTSTFAHGALETVFPAEQHQVVTAVRNMVFDLELRPVSDSPRDGFLYLKAVDESGDVITIRVTRHTRRLTSIRIRVGVLGDEAYSTALMRIITDQLDPDSKAMTPPPDLRRLRQRPSPPAAVLAAPTAPTTPPP